MDATAPTGKPKTTVTCPGCSRERKTAMAKDGTPKTPTGWCKMTDGSLLCGECVNKRFYRRSVRVKIVGLVETDDERDIKQFHADLWKAARASARFANWYVRQLFVADPANVPDLPKTKDGRVKLPPMPEVAFYEPALFPDLAPASIVALGKMVRGWYVAHRYETFVKLDRSVGSYRLGFLPIEIPKQAWSLTVGPDGKFSLRTQVGPGRSWNVRVYADACNLATIRKMLDGKVTPLGLKLVRASANSAAGSSAPSRKAWFFKIGALIERTTARVSRQEITLTLGHDAGASSLERSTAATTCLNFREIPCARIIVGGDKRDKTMQHEQSLRHGIWSRRKLKRWGQDRTAMANNRRRKVEDQIKLAAASLARWCRSHGVTSVDYDIRDRGFVSHFPWFALRASIFSALEAHGIALHVMGSEALTKLGLSPSPSLETASEV